MMSSKIKSHSCRILVVTFLVFALFAPLLMVDGANPQSMDSSQPRNISYGYFFENLGQVNSSETSFYARIPGGYLTLGLNRISVWSDSDQKSDLFIFEKMQDHRMISLDELNYRCHYFLGSRGTYTNVRCYQTLEYTGLPRDAKLLVRYFEDGIDFEVEPTDDLTPKEIDAFWESLHIDRTNLIPDSFRAKLEFDKQDGISLKYQPSQVEDHSFLSLCIGGTDRDEAKCMARDNDGNLYIAGLTLSPEFPLLNEYQSMQGGMDAFVTKLSDDGSILYSTCIGGGYSSISEPDDVAEDIAVDANGNVYLTGNTKSDDFPTENPLYSVGNNGTLLRSDYNEVQGDVFILKLNSTGNGLEYSSYYGGTNGESGTSIGIDLDGNVFVGGWTSSDNIPLVNPIDDTNDEIFDGFVFCLSAAGDELLFSSLIGGSGWEEVLDLATSESGDIVLTGYTEGGLSLVQPYDSSYGGNVDAFVIKIDSTWDVVYSTYLGSDERDQGQSVTVDGDGVAYIAGFTDSSTFPTVDAYDDTYGGGRDCFLSVISDSGDSLIYSTFIGGESADEARSVDMDSQGQIFIGGITSSSDFPMTEGSYNDGFDAFVLKMNQSSIICCSCLGGSHDDTVNAMVIDDTNNTYICGSTRSSDLTDYHGNFDVFIFGYTLYVAQPVDTNPNPEPSLQDVYYMVISTFAVAAIVVFSIVVDQVIKRLRKDQYELAMSVASTSKSEEIVIDPYREPIQEVEWNHPTDQPDGLPEPQPVPEWNHPTDQPDGVTAPTASSEWNHPTDQPDGLPEPQDAPEWNHPTDQPDGSIVPQPQPEWNHPTDQPDGRAGMQPVPEWNHPTDQPDNRPIPQVDPDWNHPTDQPDNRPIPQPEPKWNHPTDQPDRMPEPEPTWNHPTDHPDGCRCPLCILPKNMPPYPGVHWSHTSRHPPGCWCALCRGEE